MITFFTPSQSPKSKNNHRPQTHNEHRLNMENNHLFVNLFKDILKDRVQDIEFDNNGELIENNPENNPLYGRIISYKNAKKLGVKSMSQKKLNENFDKESSSELRKKIGTMSMINGSIRLYRLPVLNKCFHVMSIKNYKKDLSRKEVLFKSTAELYLKRDKFPPANQRINRPGTALQSKLPIMASNKTTKLIEQELKIESNKKHHKHVSSFYRESEGPVVETFFDRYYKAKNIYVPRIIVGDHGKKIRK